MRALVLVLLLAAAPATADELDPLRQAAARGAADELPRLRLAKALHDRGERLLAFSIVEHVRQDLPEGFLFQFHHVFRGGPASLSSEAERALLERVARSPEDVDPLSDLADLYLWQADFAKASEVLAKAARLSPDDFSLHANLSQCLITLGEAERAAEVLSTWQESHAGSEQSFAHRVQLLVGKDDEAAQAFLNRAIERHPTSGTLRGLQALLHETAGRTAEAEAAMRLAAVLADDNPGFHLTLGALDAERDPSLAREHYLTAFFIDPRAGLDAPAAVRIKELTFGLGAERGEILAGDCHEPACFAAMFADANPVVVKVGLRAAELNWREWHVEMVVGLLSHDDPDLRATAAAVLRRHVDESFEPRLRELLGSGDLHARGLCAFLAVRLLGEDSLPILAVALESPVQAIRRDAVRALGTSGLPGAPGLLAAREPVETHPVLKAEIRSALVSISHAGALARRGG